MGGLPAPAIQSRRAGADKYAPRAVPKAEQCSLRRAVGSRPLPVMWHGDGVAKWTYALAMDDLAASCPYIARLVLQNHPVNLLEHLFLQFEATQAPGAVAKRPAGM